MLLQWHGSLPLWNLHSNGLHRQLTISIINKYCYIMLEHDKHHNGKMKRTKISSMKRSRKRNGWEKKGLHIILTRKGENSANIWRIWDIYLSMYISRGKVFQGENTGLKQMLKIRVCLCVWKITRSTEWLKQREQGRKWER